MAIVLVAGTISTMIPASFAQAEYNYDPKQQYKGYEDSYGKDKDKKKSSEVNLQKVKCNNIIVNGVDSAGQGTTGGDVVNGMTADEGDDGTWEEDDQWLYNGYEKKLNNIDKNIANFCKNKNIEVVEAAEEQNGLNVGSLYIVEGPQESFEQGGSELVESIASCDTGDFVISGGFDYNSIQVPEDVPLRSIPTNTLDGWSARMLTEDGTASIQATAVCFDAQ